MKRTNEDDVSDKTTVKTPREKEPESFDKATTLPLEARARDALHKAAFVLLVDKEKQRVLVQFETRSAKKKLGLIGGKIDDVDAHSLETIARETTEETKGVVSAACTEAMRAGTHILGTSYFEKARAIAYAIRLHDSADLSIDTSNEEVASLTSLQWVPLSDIKSPLWRDEHMHFFASVLCARLVNAM